MLLSLDQFFGSRSDYKIAHTVVRLFCMIGGVLTLLLFESQKVFELIRRTPLDKAGTYWFFSSPLIVIAIAVFNSFWLGRTRPEMRALAIDWLFVLAYLAVWCFEMVRIITSVAVF